MEKYMVAAVLALGTAACGDRPATPLDLATDDSVSPYRLGTYEYVRGKSTMGNPFIELEAEEAPQFLSWPTTVGGRR